MARREEGFIDSYLLYLLAQASADASAEFHGSLAAIGVPVSKWRVLASLYPARELTIGQLSRHCLMKQSTLTRTVDRLETSGEVKRFLDTGDRRRVLVRLTPAGKRLADRLVAQAKAHEAAVLQSYSDAEIAGLKQMLDTLRRRVREPDPAGNGG